MAAAFPLLRRRRLAAAGGRRCGRGGGLRAATRRCRSVPRPSSTPSTSRRPRRSARPPSTSTRWAAALRPVPPPGRDARPDARGRGRPLPRRRRVGHAPPRSPPSAGRVADPPDTVWSSDACGRCATTAASPSPPSWTGRRSLQVLLDAARVGRPCLERLTSFVDVGDLVRVEGTTGRLADRHPEPARRGLADGGQVPAPGPVPRLRRPRDPGAAALDRPARPPARRRRCSGAARPSSGRSGARWATPASSRWRRRCSTRPTAARARGRSAPSSTRTASTCRCASRPSCTSSDCSSAGLGPIFELGRNFRNEGADATHNPEFTSLEVYQPHADYTTMRHLTERLVREAARTVHGREAIPLPLTGRAARTARTASSSSTSAASGPSCRARRRVGRGRAAGSPSTPTSTCCSGSPRTHGIAVRPEMGAGRRHRGALRRARRAGDRSCPRSTPTSRSRPRP